MKFTSNLIPYLSFKVALLPSTSAFIEPEIETQSIVAQASFVDTASLSSADTAFFSTAENEVPASFSADFAWVEERLGLIPGATKVDARSGKMVSLDLKKPILPGDGVGNHLLWSVGPSTRDGKEGAPVDKKEWSRLGVEAVKNWMIDHQSDLQIDASNELFPTLNTLFDRNLQGRDDASYTPPQSETVRTAVHGDDGDMIQISMQRTFKGVKVVDSRATATVKRGNLVNIGLETWGDIDENFNVQPRLTEESAYRLLAIHTGLTLTDEVDCKPELQIMTFGVGDLRSSGLRYPKAKFGMGYGHRLVWKVCPKFEGQDVEMMEGIVDAVSGEVLSFQDTLDYFQAKGDVYPFSNDGIGAEGDLQQDWPMPFMQIGNKVTDTGGNFYDAGAQTAKLTGPYVEMRDLCGWGQISGNRQYGIAELSQSNGIDFGGSSGTDCTTPGYGGPSNTHSSRSGFYELNKIIEIARSRLPTNTWLQGKLRSWMNIDSSCNAYWNGEVNFYRSSGSCANTGELAGVFDHEWGHGLDDNDVDGRIAKPSGEGIADVYTALRLNDSCIGRGFYKTSTCSGNGNKCLTCTGVRDIDYMNRENKSPSTYTWSKQTCGTSVHCLGYVYSEAVWSLYKRELNSFYGYDSNTSLEVVTRLTYIAAGNSQTWYSGSVPWGGCGTNSGYLSFLAADDDNGNINDGTPHMKAIYKAFNDQEIACNVPTVKDSGCSGTPTEKPVVTVVGDNSKATLSWTAVSGVSKYQVFRTEGLDCSQGKVLLATLSPNTRTYTDEGLANKRKYYYIVIPKGSNEACFGPSSECKSVIPDAGPGFELNCDEDQLIVAADPTEPSKTTTRNCIIYGTGGFTGTVSLGCDPSSLAGITCSTSPSTFSVSSTVTTTVLSIVALSSATSGNGAIVVSGTSGSITSSSTIPVTVLGAGGQQIAFYDANYGVPRCTVWGTECSSEQLLAGRGSMTNGNEPNAPNTIDGCQDGNSGTYKVDESIEKIVVRSGWTSGVGIGEPMVKGGRATIIASIYAYYTGTSDYVDFYYATEDNPNWVYIGTQQPNGGGLKDVMADYQLPQNDIHMVRVNLRYNGGASSCSIGSYNDHDDLVFAVAGTSTPPPVTSSPSKIPTPQPTEPPTKRPTPAPSKNPTNPPSEKPTPLPSSPPTSLPPTPKPSTSKPTTIPTKSPSKKPTPQPTEPPTKRPTPAPSKNPTNPPSKKPTPLPSSPPTSLPPTPKPSTSKPTTIPTKSPITVTTTTTTTTVTSTATTSQGGSSSIQMASFDSSMGAPKCESGGSGCSSGTLLNGRGYMGSGPEANVANTLDDCDTDGSSGTYKEDESIEKILVRSGDIGTPSDEIMKAGSRVTIEATVYAWSSGASDTADFYYSSTASNPIWQYIGSRTPEDGGEQVIKIAYDLPEGTTQAVRVQFRFGGQIGTCTYGSYNDRDDLVFTVNSIPVQPSRAPVKTLPPAESGSDDSLQLASFDADLGIPRCANYSSECSSGDLLKGRGLLKLGIEANRPNTLNKNVCNDGGSGTYQNDESVDKVVVRSGEENGTGADVDMVEGGRATVIATVHPWRSGGSDYADFYYAADSSNPQWQFIGTKQPEGGGSQQLKVSFTLPQGLNQAVRVNFRYRGAQGINGACSNGSYDDTDDLAFAVKSNPSFTDTDSGEIIFKEEPKDIVTDARKRNEIRINERGRRKRGTKTAKPVD